MRLATVTAILAVALPAFAVMPPVPRPAKELVIVEPSGKQSLLTSYKGKVVYIQFLYTTCPHCQNLSKVMTKVMQDLGPKGLQVIGIAFDEADAAKAAAYQKQFNVGFPVAFASRETVMSYLGISVMDRFVVPQVAVVDRKGVIRAQTEFSGEKANVNGASVAFEQLLDETAVRKFLGDLLKEGATTTTSSAPKKAAPATAKKDN